MKGLYPGKVNYIVDRRTVDIVIQEGFMGTDLIRCQIKDFPNINFKYYKEIKRIVSDVLHKKRVWVRVDDFSNTPFYRVWEAELYELDDTNHDIFNKGVEGLKSLNEVIIAEVNKVLQENDK